MPELPVIALDAMGGDNGPSVVIPGAAESLVRDPSLKYIIFGNKAVVPKWLDRYPSVAEASEFVHCEVAVRMDEKPSQALRRGRRESSMWQAIDAVKHGQADAAVSAGNTGALMAMAIFNLRTMPNIERPAIAGLWPTNRGESIVLDMGATIGADTTLLVDFAVMGAAMARAVFGQKRPTVGLLNIGVEEVKGLEPVKKAGQILRALDLPLEYHGFVEGNDLGQGVVDVVVTEGFSGNIALKTAEGTARQIGNFLKNAMSQSLRTKIGYLLAKPAFDALKEKLDPTRANGGVFLGLNGLVIKSHGAASSTGFSNAIDLGVNMVKFDVNKKIIRDIDTSHQIDTVPDDTSVQEAVTS